MASPSIAVSATRAHRFIRTSAAAICSTSDSSATFSGLICAAHSARAASKAAVSSSGTTTTAAMPCFQPLRRLFSLPFGRLRPARLAGVPAVGLDLTVGGSGHRCGSGCGFSRRSGGRSAGVAPSAGAREPSRTGSFRTPAPVTKPSRSPVRRIPRRRRRREPNSLHPFFGASTFGNRGSVRCGDGSGRAAVRTPTCSCRSGCGDRSRRDRPSRWLRSAATCARHSATTRQAAAAASALSRATTSTHNASRTAAPRHAPRGVDDPRPLPVPQRHQELRRPLLGHLRIPVVPMPDLRLLARVHQRLRRHRLGLGAVDRLPRLLPEPFQPLDLRRDELPEQRPAPRSTPRGPSGRAGSGRRP